MKKILLAVFLLNSVIHASQNTIVAFNTDGYITESSFANRYNDVVIDSNGRIIVVGGNSHSRAVIKALTNAGIVDTDFSTDELITESDNATDPDSYYGVVVDSSNRIFAVGVDGNSHGVIKAYTNNGAAYTSFSTDGQYNHSDATAYKGVGLDSSGNIFLASSGNMHIWGFESNGALIGAQGIFGITSFNAIAVDSNNRIIAVGASTSNQGVIRVCSNNLSIDNTFSGDGVITESSDDVAIYRGVAVDSNNRVIAVGDDGVAGVIRIYNSAGVLVTEIQEMSDVVTTYYAVAVDSNNRIIAVGTDNTHGVIKVYTSAGVADSSFGTSGKVTDELSWGFNSVAVDSNNKIVVAGSSTDFKGYIARYLSNGLINNSTNRDSAPLSSHSAFRDYYKALHITVGLI